MGQTVKIVTNHNRRRILDASDLTVKEAEQFKYLDWDKLEKGEDSASFFRYRHQIYDLGEFDRIVPNASEISQNGYWDGYLADSFFSGILVKYVLDDPDYDESVIVATFYAE